MYVYDDLILIKCFFIMSASNSKHIYWHLVSREIKSDEIYVDHKSSRLWSHIQILNLITNMRVNLRGDKNLKDTNRFNKIF